VSTASTERRPHIPNDGRADDLTVDRLSDPASAGVAEEAGNALDGHPLSLRIDTNVWRNSRGLQFSPIPALEQILRLAQVDLATPATAAASVALASSYEAPWWSK